MEAINIDLLLTENGDIGLILDRSLADYITGVMYDATSYEFMLESAESVPLTLNIPVEVDYNAYVAENAVVHIAVLASGRVEDAQRVPLVVFDQSGIRQGEDDEDFSPAEQSVRAFENFLQAVVVGQPIHRADLDDDESSHFVVQGMNPFLVQFAPQLMRQRLLETAPLPPHAPPGLGAPIRARSVVVQAEDDDDADDSEDESGSGFSEVKIISLFDKWS